MNLAEAGSDVTSALRDDCTGLVVVDLVEEAAAWVEISPIARREWATYFAHPWDERFGVDGFGHSVSPGNGVQRTEEVGHIRQGCPFARVARGTGELAECCAAGVADDVGLLELDGSVFSDVVGGAVFACLGHGVW